MKSALWAAVAAALFSAGCTPSKAKVCEGCSGNRLSDCESAYEACDSVDHCRRSDIKKKYADDLCSQ